MSNRVSFDCSFFFTHRMYITILYYIAPRRSVPVFLFQNEKKRIFLVNLYRILYTECNLYINIRVYTRLGRTQKMYKANYDSFVCTKNLITLQ